MIMIKAAMNRADITPPQGLELAGYPHYPRYNEGHHDPLYAACMYLNNGEQEVAMVTLDLLFFSKKHVTEVRRRVEGRGRLLGKIQELFQSVHIDPSFQKQRTGLPSAVVFIYSRSAPRSGP
jgi:hypothetical protein